MKTILNSMDKIVSSEDESLEIFRGITWADGVYYSKCKSFKINN